MKAFDLRKLQWSSIDNDDSRDLDQVEYAERTSDGAIEVMIGIADVDESVLRQSAIDSHAFANTTFIYTPTVIFPMLPEQLSTDPTSLLGNADRVAVIDEMIVASPKGTYVRLLATDAERGYIDFAAEGNDHHAGAKRCTT